jgi:hypothetical protein
MATLTGTKIANTYKQLLQVGSSNTGLTGTVQAVQDGEGNASPLELSQNAVNINGTFQLSGVTLTANASTLNAVADLTGATGMIAVSGGSVYGRTITGGAGVSISNADGTEGNPTIALNTTGVVSASYGPATNIEVNAVGQIVSAGAATSVSVSGVTANTFTGGTFAGTTGDFSSNVSVGGNLVLAGQFSPASLSVTGTINANKISATDATFNNIVSAGFFVGDGSGLVNVPSAEGGTVKAITAGTGIKLTVDAVVTTTIPVSGTVAVSANQNFGTVSVSTALAVTGSALFGIVSATNIDTDELLIAGVSAATVNEVAAVSALTSVNLAAITSINAVLDSVSAATSVNSAAITSINVVVANVSALTSVNAAAITSINTVTDNLATSIGNSNTNIATVSALTSVNLAAITSINVVVANVSALTSVNAAAITSINAVIEGNVSADSGTFNTLTVITSASVGGTFNVGGNVGIGTSSPASKLQVTTASSGATPSTSYDDVFIEGSGNAGITIGSGTTDFGGLIFADSASGVAGFMTYHHNTDSLRLGVAANERMRIDSAGNVGIGTTSPVTNLHVVAAAAGGQLIVATTQADATSKTGTVATQHYTNAEEPVLGLAINSTSTENNVIIGGLFTQFNAATKISFYTASNNTTLGGSERMRIDSSGNVGIGTTSPATFTNGLAVAGSGNDGDVAVINDTVGAWSFKKVRSDNSNAMGIYDPTGFGVMALYTAGAERMRIDNVGNLTMAATQGPALMNEDASNTNPTLIPRKTDTGTGWGSNGANNLEGIVGSVRSVLFGSVVTTFHNSGGTEVARIDRSSGNVGIGTSSPAKQLHITKSAKADIGTLTDGATITPDFDANQNFSVTLGGNRTLANPSNIDAGQTGSIFVVQDGTGSRTLSFGTYWKFAGGTAPTLSTAVSVVDRIDYIVYTSIAIHAVATLNVS